ncbi:MAG TPA: argininosuccinate lyase, partial [Treponema sp.]|nr:argininosuccinate lyase [Treponema sp.]
DALDCVQGNIIVFEAMIASARWNKEKMAASCEGGFANATDLAEYLVRKGVPFRTAHGISAKAVRMAIDAGLSKIEDLCVEEFKKCSPLIEDDVYEILSPEACVENRKTIGAPSSESTSVQIKALIAFCKKGLKK